MNSGDSGVTSRGFDSAAGNYLDGLRQPKSSTSWSYPRTEVYGLERVEGAPARVSGVSAAGVDGDAVAGVRRVRHRGGGHCLAEPLSRISLAAVNGWPELP